MDVWEVYPTENLREIKNCELYTKAEMTEWKNAANPSARFKLDIGPNAQKWITRFLRLTKKLGEKYRANGQSNNFHQNNAI